MQCSSFSYRVEIARSSADPNRICPMSDKQRVTWPCDPEGPNEFVHRRRSTSRGKQRDSSSLWSDDPTARERWGMTLKVVYQFFLSSCFAFLFLLLLRLLFGLLEKQRLNQRSSGSLTRIIRPRRNRSWRDYWLLLRLCLLFFNETLHSCNERKKQTGKPSQRREQEKVSTVDNAIDRQFTMVSNEAIAM